MQQAWGNSHINRSVIPPQCLLLAADSMSRRDSSWDEASSLIPSPIFLLSFLHTPSVHQLSVCVPASLALTGWLESHSGTVAPRPKQGLMSKDTLFSLFPLPHGDHLWYVWSYLCLPITGDVDWVSVQWDFCIRFKHLYNLHHFFFPGKTCLRLPLIWITLGASDTLATTLMLKAMQELFCVQIL